MASVGAVADATREVNSKRGLLSELLCFRAQVDILAVFAEFATGLGVQPANFC